MTDHVRPKVLLVDDTKTNLTILVQALRDEYKLGVATSGAEALAYAQEKQPDLILLDIMMPEMDGYEVCRRLKAEPRTRSIPVIFITALDEIQNKTQGFALGAVDYITKPFEVVEVKARVRTHLQIAQYQRELEAKNQALQQAQARLQQQVRELEGRDRLVHAQMSATSVGQAGEEILQVYQEVLGIARGVLYQVDEKGKLLVVKAILGSEAWPASIPCGDPRSPVALAFCQQEPRQTAEGGIAVPLLFRKKVLGVLWLEGIVDPLGDREAALNALWRLAGEAALVLRAAQVAEDLEQGKWEVEELLKLEE